MKNLVELGRLVTYIKNKKIQSFVSVAKCSYFCSKIYTIPESFKYYQKNIALETCNNIRYLSISQCNFAKNRDRGKDKKKKNVAQHIDEREISELIDVDKLKIQLDKALENLKNDFMKNINVRSSIGSIEELSVKLDGKNYTIQELAQILRKPKMVVINANTFPQALPNIIEALSKSGMNLNPQQDGTTIFVPTPKVTKEHRELLSKNAKTAFIKCRDHLKNVQNKYIKNIQDKTGIAADLSHRVQNQIKALCQKYVIEGEKILEAKQKELLGTSD